MRINRCFDKSWKAEVSIYDSEFEIEIKDNEFRIACELEGCDSRLSGSMIIPLETIEAEIAAYRDEMKTRETE